MNNKDIKWDKHKRIIEEIRIVWGRDDVITTMQQMNVKLTNDEINEVLLDMYHDHDASLGISWETIEYTIRNVIRNRKRIIETKGKSDEQT